MKDNKLFYDIVGWHKFSGQSDFTTIKIGEDEFIVATRKQFQHLIEVNPNAKLPYNSNYEAKIASIVVFWETSTEYLFHSFGMHYTKLTLTNRERNQKIIYWLKRFFEEVGVEFALESITDPISLMVYHEEGSPAYPFDKILENLDSEEQATELVD